MATTGRPMVEHDAASGAAYCDRNSRLLQLPTRCGGGVGGGGGVVVAAGANTYITCINTRVGPLSAADQRFLGTCFQAVDNDIFDAGRRFGVFSAWCF